MSLQAISWALEESESSGNDRLVLIVMCHYTNDDGFSGLSKATLASETKLSEATTIRSQQRLTTLGEIERMTAAGAPQWWLDIPANRRPALFRMTAFLGSHYATSIRRRAGVAQGSRRGITGVNRTPSDQAVRDAKRDQRTEKVGAPLETENDKPADPACVRCHGSGLIYRGGDAAVGARDVRCSCTFVRQPGEIFAGIDEPTNPTDPVAPPPWVQQGMTWAEWRDRESA